MTSHADLFRHVSAERAGHYRAVMETFAAAKRQFRLHLRPDEVRGDTGWPGETPSPETVQQLLAQLVEWGNLQAQPDTARVSSIEDFYRARFLYRLSTGGEAVETALEAFERALSRRGELQSVALDDILARLTTLRQLAQDAPPDAAKVHEALRDLVHVFTGLADNAQAFMAGITRSIELQRAEAAELMAYKARLVTYLERFIGDLVARSGRIATSMRELAPHAGTLLAVAAAREARDAAPGDEGASELRLGAWQERWTGLERWFLSDGHAPSQAEQLRARARAAIPQLLGAIATFNERRSGKSDRSADYRVLARWFAETNSEADARRLARASFALQPARHLSLVAPDTDVPAATPWAAGPRIAVHPRLRERARLAPRGPRPKVRDRGHERSLLASRLAEEQAREDAARARLATGEPVLLSELGVLDRHQLRALLDLLGQALSEQPDTEATVARASNDGALHIVLEPGGAHDQATVETELGHFTGRDHRLTITATGAGE